VVSFQLKPSPCSTCNTGAKHAGQLLRRATPEDRARHRELNELIEGRPPEFIFGLTKIRELKLPMKLVDVERPFGGGRIVFYFSAEGRVDFRQLVRELAREFHTRIEMRQINVREQAKVLGDIADCGRELCCRTWLVKMPPISMKMAKVQKTTLDPAKISGQCGRLKCCLRYEFEQYLDLRRALPPEGSRVRLGPRAGFVAAVNPLGQVVTVLFEDGERLVTGPEQLEVVQRGKGVLGEDRPRKEPPPASGEPPHHDDEAPPADG
jgi:cell fate regulator YaaT (PSP1 superfamily)